MWRVKYPLPFICFLILCIILPSCSLPQDTQPKTQQANDFKIKQVSDEMSANELPIVPDSNDEIEFIEKERDVPIEYRLERTYPKNLALNVGDTELAAVQREPIVLEPWSASELKQDSKNTVQAWLQWFKSFYKTLRAEHIQIRRSEIHQAKEDFEQTKNLIAKGQARQDYKQAFQEAQKQRRSKLKQFRQEMKAAYKKDRETIRTQIKTLFSQPTQQSNFTVQEDLGGFFLGLLKLAVCVAGGCLYDLGKAIVNLSVSQNPLPSEPQAAIPRVKDPNETRSVPNTAQLIPEIDQNPIPVVVGDNNAVKPAATTESTGFDNNALKETALKMALDLNQQFANNPDLKALISQFRVGKMLEKLGIQVNQSPYLNCSEISSSIQEPSGGCDYALAAVVYEALSNGGSNFSLNPNRQLEISVIYANNTNGQAADWLIGLLNHYYETDPANDTPAEREANANLIHSRLNNQKIIFEIVTSEVCKQEAKLEYTSSELSSFRSTARVKTLLVDGDYTFKLSYAPANDSNNSQKTYLINETVEDLAQRLDRAAYQLSNPLSMIGLLAPSQINTYTPDKYFPHEPRLGVKVENATGNLWDLKLSSVSSGGCLNPLFKAECIDSSSSEYTLNPLRYSPGRYRIETQYSVATDPAGKPVRGVNIEPGSHQTDYYDFIALNAAYSTFARQSEYPETSSLTATIADASASLTTKPLNVRGIHQIADIETLDDQDFNPPSLKPLPGSTVFDQNLPGTEMLPTLRQRIQEFQASAVGENNENSTSLTLKQSLFADLIQNNYAPLRRLELNNAAQGSYLNVGAVVNLVNPDTSLNMQLLVNPSVQNNRIPMLLQVVRGTAQSFDPNNPAPDPVVRSWPFSAKIGSYTVVQEYWDGRTVADPYSFDEDQVPNYEQGEYHVRVIIDKNAIQGGAPNSSGSMLSSLRISPYNGAYLAYPTLAKSSSKADISIPSSTRAIRLTKIQPLNEEDFSFTVEGKMIGVGSDFDPHTLKLDFEGMHILGQDLVSYKPSTGEFILLVKNYEFTLEPIQFETQTIENLRVSAFYDPEFSIADSPLVGPLQDDKFIVAEVHTCEMRRLMPGQENANCNTSVAADLAAINQSLKYLHDYLKELGLQSAEHGGVLGIFAATAFNTTIELTVPSGVADVLITAFGGRFVKAGTKVVSGVVHDIIRIPRKDYFNFVEFIRVESGKSGGKLFEALVKYVYKLEGIKIIREGEELYVNGIKGEIDFETADAIYEVGLSIAHKKNQLLKLAEVAQDRGKKLIVVHGPKAEHGTIKAYQKSLNKQFPGLSVEFKKFDYLLE